MIKPILEILLNVPPLPVIYTYALFPLASLQYQLWVAAISIRNAQAIVFGCSVFDEAIYVGKVPAIETAPCQSAYFTRSQMQMSLEHTFKHT